MKKIISCQKLYFRYEDSKQLNLKDISLDINKGEWVSILGHNGSGKSTLAKLLVGLESANKGKIFYYKDDEEIELNDKTIGDIRNMIAIVFQNPENQFVGVSVRHDIAFGLENRNLPQEEMEETVLKCAKVVGMEELLDRAPSDLSGGQKQKVAIAGAVAIDPDIIIFDEATSMLDPEGSSDIVELIKTLNKEHGKSVITITHDLRFASLSDKVIVMNQGQITFSGTPREMYQNFDILKESNLELPPVLKVINSLDPIKNKKVIDSLWQLVLRN